MPQQTPRRLHAPPDPSTSVQFSGKLRHPRLPVHAVPELCLQSPLPPQEAGGCRCRFLVDLVFAAPFALLLKSSFSLRFPACANGKPLREALPFARRVREQRHENRGRVPRKGTRTVPACQGIPGDGLPDLRFFPNARDGEALLAAACAAFRTQGVA